MGRYNGNGSNSTSGGYIAPPWVSGEIVNKWDARVSQLDGETYQRTAASGSGTTDPADDNTNYVAKSYRRTSSLPNKPGVENNSNSATQFAVNAIKTAINGITAGTRTKILDISGRGTVLFLALMKADVNGGRIEVIVDGITIFDNTAATPTGSTANLLIGSPGSGDPGTGTVRPFAYAIPESAGVEFRRTFVVWYTPATTATGANAALAYEVRASR